MLTPEEAKSVNNRIERHPMIDESTVGMAPKETITFSEDRPIVQQETTESKPLLRRDVPPVRTPLAAHIRQSLYDSKYLTRRAGEEFRAKLSSERRRVASGVIGGAAIIAGLAWGAFEYAEPIYNTVEYTRGLPGRTGTAVKNTFSNIAEYLERPEQKINQDFANKAQDFRSKRGMP